MSLVVEMGSRASGGAQAAVVGRTIRVIPVHIAVPGRMRLKVSNLYRNSRLQRALETELTRDSEFKMVKASALTANVLVAIGADTTLDLVVSRITAIAGRDAKSKRQPTAEGARPSAAREASEARDHDVVALHAWHRLSSAKALAILRSDSKSGLSGKDAAARLKRYGINALPEPLRRGRSEILLAQLQTVPVGLLTASAVISLLTGGLIDAIAILGVVAINAGIGFATENRAEQTIAAMNKQASAFALVRRDGVTCHLPAEAVVPGDILRLTPDAKIAADARLLDSQDLRIDESALTGESLPIRKRPAMLRRRQVPIGDRTNMVYRGTTVVSGLGSAMVVATGQGTEFGKIQQLLSQAEAPETPVQRQLGTTGRQLAIISSVICSGVFVLGLLQGRSVLDMMKNTIALGVAAVPEGLPAIATTTLALGVRDMRYRKVLVRKLGVVETLGSVQVICFDKTGTLTENQMSVVALHDGAHGLHVADGQIWDRDVPIDLESKPVLLKLIEVAALCNDCRLRREQGEWVVTGSPTEAALLRLALSSGLDVDRLRRRYRRLSRHDRSQRRSFMATSHAIDKGTKLVAVKGRPSEVVERCSWQLNGGILQPLSEADRAAIAQENEHLAGSALRVLGFAYRIADRRERSLEKPLVWLGLAGMADPVRPGMKETVAAFHRAGIDTVMATGDQGATAYAIARQLDLSNGRPVSILESGQIEQMDPEKLRALAQRAHVFARISPEHKLQIVRALQGNNRIVAMTGDGINDGPALKGADIGVAMGRSGTEVARDVADIVLLDDRLSSMAEAIKRGRTTYANVQKTIRYLLSTNASELIVVGGGSLLTADQVLSPKQLLWINLISDIFPGLALAVEPPQPDILDAPPRDPNELLLSVADFKQLGVEAGIISAGSLGAYGLGALRYGPGPQARSMAFLSMVSAQLLHALSSRSRKTSIFGPSTLPPNPHLKRALIGSFGVQGLALAVPSMRRLLGVGPLSMVDLVATVAGSVVPFLAIEGLKLRRRRAARQQKNTAADVRVLEASADNQTSLQDEALS